MPNTPSAIKRLRSDAKKRIKNQTALSELNTLDKKLRVLAKDPEQARQFATRVISRYDRAVSRGIIPANRAARKKSRIARFFTHLKAK